jgi:hypothetical protein
MKVQKSAQMEDFNMRLANVNGELVEATVTGERATCRECQTELYARLRPRSGHEFTWVHFVAGDCTLSYDREYLYGNNATASVPQVVTEIEVVTPENNDERLDRLKQKVRLSGELSDAHECIKFAIIIKPQPSIPGIVSGLKTNLLRRGNVSDEDLIGLNAMTTKKFYLAEQGAHSLSGTRFIET